MLAGNVLMVSNYPSDTGYAWWLMEHFWKQIAETTHARGDRAFLAFPEIRQLSDTVKNAPITPITLDMTSRSMRPPREVREFLRKNEIRTIYYTDSPYLSGRYLWFRTLGVHHVIVHDHTPGDRLPVTGLVGAVKAAINRLPWLTADKVFCVSPLMRERSLRTARIPPGKVYTVQNGIPEVQCEKDARSSIRSEFGLSDDEIVIVTTGRAHPYKRWDLVINAAAKLRDRAPDLRFNVLLVGDGYFMPELRELVEKLALGDCIRFCGFRKDTHRILCASDVAMHAAKGEGFSLSILEYLSAGLPTLVPDIPSVSQAIRQGENGFVYSDNDPEDAARYLLQLAQDKKLRGEMSANATACVASRYSLEQCTEAFKEALAAAAISKLD